MIYKQKKKLNLLEKKRKLLEKNNFELTLSIKELKIYNNRQKYFKKEFRRKVFWIKENPQVILKMIF